MRFFNHQALAVVRIFSPVLASIRMGDDGANAMVLVVVGVFSDGWVAWAKQHHSGRVELVVIPEDKADIERSVIHNYAVEFLRVGSGASIELFNGFNL